MIRTGGMNMEIRESVLDGTLEKELTALSRAWAAEQSCRGYFENGPEAFAGRRFITAREDGRLVGYLFGLSCEEEKGNTVVAQGERYFEIEELYVVPACRSQGVGRALCEALEEALRGETRVILLSTATKNWKRILHFYIDELGMSFWSARLFKEIGE